MFGVPEGHPAVGLSMEESGASGEVWARDREWWESPVCAYLSLVLPASCHSYLALDQTIWGRSGLAQDVALLTYAYLGRVCVHLCVHMCSRGFCIPPGRRRGRSQKGQSGTCPRKMNFAA